eukprot:5145387-Karenia_brevis.AAC.1
MSETRSSKTRSELRTERLPEEARQLIDAAECCNVPEQRKQFFKQAKDTVSAYVHATRNTQVNEGIRVNGKCLKDPDDWEAGANLLEAQKATIDTPRWYLRRGVVSVVLARAIFPCSIPCNVVVPT